MTTWTQQTANDTTWDNQKDPEYSYESGKPIGILLVWTTAISYYDYPDSPFTEVNPSSATWTEVEAS